MVAERGGSRLANPEVMVFGYKQAEISRGADTNLFEMPDILIGGHNSVIEAGARDYADMKMLMKCVT